MTALWREALLAQKVLRGLTKGYKRHPQLARFRDEPRPLAAIGSYLAAVADEAVRRGYRFDARKITPARARRKLTVTRGQLAFERKHLLRKLKVRSPRDYAARRGIAMRPHPLFRAVSGGVADWERP